MESPVTDCNPTITQLGITLSRRSKERKGKLEEPQAREMEKFWEEHREQQATFLLETQSCHHCNLKLKQITMQGEHAEVFAEYLIPGGIQRGWIVMNSAGARQVQMKDSASRCRDRSFVLESLLHLTETSSSWNA